jgi:hypothetical protein
MVACRKIIAVKCAPGTDDSVSRRFPLNGAGSNFCVPGVFPGIAFLGLRSLRCAGLLKFDLRVKGHT